MIFLHNRFRWGKAFPQLLLVYGLLIGGFLLVSASSASATTIYVDSSASGSNTGADWANAYTDLQDAIDAATVGDEIWVAKGTYLPTKEFDADNSGGSDPREKTFYIDLDGIKIYGGYPSGGGSRDLSANPTTLSGDIGTFGDSTDNAYHVVFIDGTTANGNITAATLLDGLTVTRGNADGSFPHADGGGVYNDATSSNKVCSPTFVDCSFIRNYAVDGGGMFSYAFGGTSIPTLMNCFFYNNSAYSGGGMYNQGTYGTSSPTLINCSFSGNSANNGGGIYNLANPNPQGASSPTLYNCSFSSNSALNNGGGIYSLSFGDAISSPSFTNCILWGNTANFSGPNVNNNSATPTYSHSIIQGSGGSGNWNNSFGTDGGNNLDEDPFFVSATDLSLRPCSPCIDAGDGTSGNSANTTTEDLTGNPRFFNADTIDIGAYEYQGAFASCCPFTDAIYVDSSATGNNDGTSWADAFADLQEAIDAVAANNSCVTEIWVAKGTYYPTTCSPCQTSDREISFTMKEGVAIYGGFDGSENERSDRDWAANLTILSGNIDQNDGPNFANNDNNSYHVVFNDDNGLDDLAILDGFTITAGNADGADALHEDGGGMFNKNSSPTVSNCSFTGNYATLEGGGMYNEDSSPKVANCSFIRNFAFNNGGGMLNRNSSSAPEVTNCSFSGNKANTGGGMNNFFASTVVVTNCSFSGNKAINGGGGMSHAFSSPVVTNCIFWGNSSEIHEFNSTLTISHSIVQDDYAGGMNILDKDPLFISQPDYSIAPTTDGDLGLQQCSPAINTGNKAAYDNLSGPANDLAGNTRIVHDSIDMGAYEYQGALSTLNIACKEAFDIYLDADGNATLVPDSLDIGTTADCPITFTASQTTFNCDDLPPPPNFTHSEKSSNSITLTATTAGGVQSTCQVEITVRDTIKPNALCKLHTIQLDAQGSGSLTIGEIDNGSSDACGISFSFASQTTFDCDDVGATTVILTVRDASFNSDTCHATVTIKDEVLPHAQCKDATVEVNASGATVISPSAIDNGSSDACGIAVRSVMPGKVTCNDEGTLTATLKVTDESGNEQTCTATITVVNVDNLCCPSGSILHVDINTPNSSDGSDWDNAFATLEEALGYASTCTNFTEIWVAAGTYHPTNGTDRMASFSLLNGIAIYGGFPTGGTGDRDPAAHVTTLSGDIGTAGDSTDNSYHVVRNGNGTDATAILDGFTITGGNANKLLHETEGGGMLNEGASPTVRNCIFNDNTAISNGGGLYNGSAASPTLLNCTFGNNSAANGGGMANSGGSSPTVDSCSFAANSATSNGGAVHNDASSPVFTGCHFMANSTGGSGGAISNIAASAPALTGCTLQGNTAGSFGGGIYAAGASLPSLENCLLRGNTASLGGGVFCTSSSNATAVNSTFHANSAQHGGAVHSQSATPVLKNCILWGDTASAEVTGTATITHSIVQGGHAGTGNLDADPLFMSATDLRTPPCSPAIDAGDNAAPTSPVDILGNPRTKNNWGASKVDMGAYELPADLTVPCTWTNGGDGLLWSDGLNWNDGFAPGRCRDVLIPTGFSVIVPTGYEALGKTLEVELGGEVTTEPAGTVDIDP